MANGRKTGGRQAGTPNRKTAEQALAMDASGMSPLDYLVTLYLTGRLIRKDQLGLPMRRLHTSMRAGLQRNSRCSSTCRIP